MVKKQSPINITTHQAMIQSKKSIFSSNNSSNNSLMYFNAIPVNVINNSHGIQFVAKDSPIMEGLIIDNKCYHFRQMHFHTPSEHLGWR